MTVLKKTKKRTSLLLSPTPRKWIDTIKISLEQQQGRRITYDELMMRLSEVWYDSQEV